MKMKTFWISFMRHIMVEMSSFYEWSGRNGMIWFEHHMLCDIMEYGQVDNNCRPMFFSILKKNAEQSTHVSKLHCECCQKKSCIVNNWNSGITLVDVSFQVAAFLSDNQIHYKCQTVFSHGTHACPFLLCRSSRRAWNCLPILKNLMRHRKPQAPLDYVQQAMILLHRSRIASDVVSSHLWTGEESECML
jgi:hypothetical protein